MIKVVKIQKNIACYSIRHLSV